MRTYKAVFTDKYGTENINITSNGNCLYTTIRNVKFEGGDFEALENKNCEGNFEYNKYKNGSGELTNFRLKITFPIKIEVDKKESSATITFYIETGKNLPIDGLKSIVNSVELVTPNSSFSSAKKVEWFEDAIVNIQNLLPKNTLIKTCLSCKYSNYHPCGNGMFGNIYCFKKLKQQTKLIKNKTDLLNLWTEKAIKNDTIFSVQETYDCSEHEFVSKNDWVYKSWNA